MRDARFSRLVAEFEVALGVLTTGLVGSHLIHLPHDTDPISGSEAFVTKYGPKLPPFGCSRCRPIRLGNLYGTLISAQDNQALFASTWMRPYGELHGAHFAPDTDVSALIEHVEDQVFDRIPDRNP